MFLRYLPVFRQNKTFELGMCLVYVWAILFFKFSRDHGQCYMMSIHVAIRTCWPCCGHAVLEIWIVRILQQVGHLPRMEFSWHRTRTFPRTDLKILEAIILYPVVIWTTTFMLLSCFPASKCSNMGLLSGNSCLSKAPNYIQTWHSVSLHEKCLLQFTSDSHGWGNEVALQGIGNVVKNQVQPLESSSDLGSSTASSRQ